jgi:hypothetical protein
MDEPAWSYHTAAICLYWVSHDLTLGKLDLRLSRQPEPDRWYAQVLETWKDTVIGSLWFRRIGDASPRQAAFALLRLLQATLAAEADEADPLPVETLMLWIDEDGRRCVHIRDGQVHLWLALEPAGVTSTYRASPAGPLSRYLP